MTLERFRSCWFPNWEHEPATDTEKHKKYRHQPGVEQRRNIGKRGPDHDRSSERLSQNRQRRRLADPVNIWPLGAETVRPRQEAEHQQHSTKGGDAMREMNADRAGQLRNNLAVA